MAQQDPPGIAGPIMETIRKVDPAVFIQDRRRFIVDPTSNSPLQLLDRDLVPFTPIREYQARRPPLEMNRHTAVDHRVGQVANPR